MANANNHISAKFSVIVCCVLAVLASASPCGATTWVFSGDTLDINDDTYDYVILYGGTVNLHQHANVNYLDVYDGKLNVYGGQVGHPILILSDPDIVVTVYGSDFATLDSEGNEVPLVDEDGEPLSQFTPTPYEPTRLTGTYESGDQITLGIWAWGEMLIHLVLSTPAPEMAIDIKPDSDTNVINLKSKGVVPVAVLTSGAFDAGQVDPATALFAGAAPAHWTLEDVDGDGDKDMLFHFRTQELNLDENSTEATLTARLTAPAPLRSQSADQMSNGPAVSGTDKVRILSSKK